MKNSTLLITALVLILLLAACSANNQYFDWQPNADGKGGVISYCAQELIGGGYGLYSLDVDEKPSNKKLNEWRMKSANSIVPLSECRR